MSVNETLSKKVYRTLKTIDGSGNKTWNKLAFWTTADQVEMENGDNAQDVLESILMRSLTIYVSPSGSDTTGNGSNGSPYLTISKAINTIPKNLNNFVVDVNVYAGTYDETIIIKGYHGGSLRIKFQANLDTIINGGIYTETTDSLLIYQSGTGTANVTINPTGSYGIRADLGSKVYMTNLSITVNGNSSVTGLLAVSGASIYTTSFSLVVNNAYIIITSTRNASIYVSAVLGTGNTTGIDASSGGIVSYGAYSASATTNYKTSAGGIITNDLVVQSQIATLDAKIGAKVVVSATAPADTSAVWVY